MSELRFQRAVKPRWSEKPMWRVESELLARAEVPSGQITGCWLWTGPVGNHGYGTSGGGSTGEKLVHRIAHVLFIGPIPPRYQVDHVAKRGCTSKLCINPAHLEAVTQRENLIRQGEAVTHCPRGHEYTAENTYRSPKAPRCRRCRECVRVTRAVTPLLAS